ncbi:MAG: lactate utilization protein [Breznakibacter sp.]
MNNNPVGSRDEILANLRRGRSLRKDGPFEEPEWESPVFPVPTDLLDTFKNELEAISGKVFAGNSADELIDRLQLILDERNIDSLYCLDGQLMSMLGHKMKLQSSREGFDAMEAAITRCECLVARTGSIMVSSAHESGRRLNVFPPVHVVWAQVSQLVPFVDDALQVMKSRYPHELPSQITLVSGASRTADIEKTLVMGAHGPKELIVLIDTSK